MLWVFIGVVVCIVGIVGVKLKAGLPPKTREAYKAAVVKEIVLTGLHPDNVMTVLYPTYDETVEAHFLRQTSHGRLANQLMITYWSIIFSQRMEGVYTAKDYGEYCFECFSELHNKFIYLKNILTMIPIETVEEAFHGLYLSEAHPTKAITTIRHLVGADRGN